MKIKICGVRDAAMATQASQAGVDFIGIICHRSSRRYIAPENIKAIADATGSASAVAVFTDHGINEMQKICQLSNIQVVQLHGEHSRQQHAALAEHISRIYVLHVDETGQVMNQPAMDLQPQRDYLLFDGLQGGSGKTIDCRAIQQEAKGFRYFIAGGVNASNVAAIIHEHQPFAIDSSSGVEDPQGDQSLDKIIRLIESVRSVSNDR